MTERHSDPVIYLDHAATTPLDPQVGEAMLACCAGDLALGNPSSPHLAGRRAAAVIEHARRSVAELLGADARSIVFTSGATEADNLAVIGGASFRAHRGRHVVTMTTEHKAVAAAFDALESDGYRVTRLPPQADGLLSLDDFEAALEEDTQLVSVMHVNNETGVIQPIERIGRICRERGILFHVDAAQSAGKLPLDVARLPIDLLSLTAHKFYGPQGIGALCMANRPGCGVKPLLHGGEQERRLRPGTEPVALIAGFGKAAELARARMGREHAHVRSLCDRLWAGIADLSGIRRNGSLEQHYPGILNVSAEGVEGESLLLALEPLCVASGSACNTLSSEASPVLKAMGLDDVAAQSAIRFSFGRGTTADDIGCARAIYRAAVGRLRSISAAARAIEA